MWDHLRHKDAYKTAESSQEDHAAKKENDGILEAQQSLYQLNTQPQPSLEQYMERNFKWSKVSHARCGLSDLCRTSYLMTFIHTLR